MKKRILKVYILVKTKAELEENSMKPLCSKPVKSRVPRI